MQRALGKASKNLLEGNSWGKISTPTVSRGATAIPKNPSAVERIGVRLDNDDTGDFTYENEGGKWHKFGFQVNVGNKISSAFKRWREEQPSSTHTVMAKVTIEDCATKDEIEKALMEANKGVEGV
ncbi:hypothetical protein BD779DRAFT_1443202 [Infundibulicybe gibba]|nr:hypothetical protein BD779DRAFT_1443202 [Infundibulicybe gibba]